MNRDIHLNTDTVLKIQMFILPYVNTVIYTAGTCIEIFGEVKTFKNVRAFSLLIVVCLLH